MVASDSEDEVDENDETECSAPVFCAMHAQSTLNLIPPNLSSIQENDIMDVDGEDCPFQRCAKVINCHLETNYNNEASN